MTKQYVDQIIEEAIQEGLLSKGIKLGAKYGMAAGSKAGKVFKKAPKKQYFTKPTGKITKDTTGYKKLASNATSVAKDASKKVVSKLKSFLKTRKSAKVVKPNTTNAVKAKKLEAVRKAAQTKNNYRFITKPRTKIVKSNNANSKLFNKTNDARIDARTDILTKSRRTGITSKTKTGNPLAVNDKRKYSDMVPAYKKKK